MLEDGLAIAELVKREERNAKRRAKRGSDPKATAVDNIVRTFTVLLFFRGFSCPGISCNTLRLRIHRRRIVSLCERAKRLGRNKTAATSSNALTIDPGAFVFDFARDFHAIAGRANCR